LFLHIGDSQVVPVKKIIGIFHYDRKSTQANKRFLQSDAANALTREEEKYYNAFVVTTDYVYYSPISPLTLQKRMARNTFIEKGQED